MRASQFIDFINRREMPPKEEQLTYYTHIDLEDDRGEVGNIIKTNRLKKIRRKYRLDQRRNKCK